MSIVSDLPSEITEGDNLSVSINVHDNDPTFSQTGSESGIVELGYNRPGGFSWKTMNILVL